MCVIKRTAGRLLFASMVAGTTVLASAAVILGWATVGNAGNLTAPLNLVAFPGPGSLDHELHIASSAPPRSLTCVCLTEESGFGGGDGTETDPYVVCKPEHILTMPTHLADHFIQTADIDLTGYRSAPIGQHPTPFTGSYNGQGFMISNLTINLPPPVFDVGLFGRIGGSGSISNLRLVNVNVTGGDAVGGLVGTAEAESGQISNVSVSGAVTSIQNEVGGLAGLSRMPISQCFSTAIVSGTSHVGGLVGYVDGGQISDSYSNSSVTASSTACGGLLGVFSDFGSGSIDNCYSSGSATCPKSAGGLIGRNDFGSTVNSCFWDTESSGNATSDGGIGKTTVEMQMQATFDPPWDFATPVWTIDEGNDYPRLKFETDPPPLCQMVPILSAQGLAVTTLLILAVGTLVSTRRRSIQE